MDATSVINICFLDQPIETHSSTALFAEVARIHRMISEDIQRGFLQVLKIAGKQHFELMAQTSQDLVWASYNNKGESFASRETKTASGSKYLKVFKRTKSDDKQMDLFSKESYRYDCIATNEFAKPEEEIFKFYNQRANIENNIREMKYDYALGKIITESFDTSAVFYQLFARKYLT